MTQLLTRLTRAWGLVLMFLAVSPGAAAHPLSTFGVQVRVSDRTVTVTINADGGPWLARLNALSPRPVTGESVPARVDAHRALVETRSHLWADDVRVALVADPTRINADGQLETTLRGALPANPRSVRWQSGLIFGTYPVSVSVDGDPTETLVWLDGREATDDLPVTDDGRQGATFGRYVVLGFEHILPKGLDHILFVLGLFLLTPRVRPLLAQVSVFTVAHSVSLGLAMSGLVTLSPAIIEPLIALSIAYVGIENVVRAHLSRSRLWLVGAFGLLHGLGFAGVLADLGLPGTQWVTALVGFNVGVELGQIVVLGLAAIGAAAWAKVSATPVDAARRVASAGIAAMGVIWVIGRV